MTHRLLRPTALLIASFTLGLSPVIAQTTLHFYRGGEGVGGAVNGGVLTALTDEVGYNPFSSAKWIEGNPGATYTDGTRGGGSTLAANLNGNVVFSAFRDNSLTNDSSFAMELWFKPTSISGAQALIYNGYTAQYGLGLYLYGDQLQALAGGVAFQPTSVAPTADAWNYAALVYDNGSLRVFLNDAQVLSSIFTFNNPIGGGLTLGGNSLIGDRFSGSMDDIKVFSFAPGTFTPSMLNNPAFAAVPEPSTYAALAGAVALGFAAWRRRRTTT